MGKAERHAGAYREKEPEKPRNDGGPDAEEEKKSPEAVWNETDRIFFKKASMTQRFCPMHFHTIEAAFRIEGKFRTCKYI